MTAKKQPDGTWSVDFYTDGRGSTRVRRSGFKSKAHAVRFERDYDDKPDVSMMRFSAMVDLWYEVHGVTLKNGLSRRNLLKQIAARLGDPLSTDFTAVTWSRYRVERLKSSKQSSINVEQTYTCSVFTKLTELGHYQGLNPLAGIKLFKRDQTELSFLSFPQIDQLLAEVAKSGNPYLSIIVRLALATGARWAEVERLRRSQILTDRLVFTQTKNGRNRTVPVDPALIREALAVSLPTERIFSNSRGAFESCYTRCGFNTPGQLTHILRHTFASHFVMAGGDLRTLRDILGHADIKMTMRYAHLAPEHLDKALALNPLALKTAGSPAVVNA